MQLLGLSLIEVLAVFAGVGAAILGLYFLRVRRREILVPFAPLFEELLMEHQRERLFGRLRWLLSLLLALLFCAALAFALGDPRRSTAGDASRASPTQARRLARTLPRTKRNRRASTRRSDGCTGWWTNSAPAIDS